MPSRGFINLLGPLFVRVFKPGASDVKSVLKFTASNSTTRATAITPTSGKKVRIISCAAVTSSSTAVHFETYFGTGTNITTNAGKEILYAALVLSSVGASNVPLVWPDGGGPVGAVDEVVSIRTGDADISALGKFVIHYREE